MTALGMNGFALVALLVSVATFVAILIWIWTRPREQIDAQARLYEDDGDGPPEAQPPEDRPPGDPPPQ